MSRHYPRARTGEDRAILYDEITNKIIGELEAGRVPWVQPWGTTASPSLPRWRPVSSPERRCSSAEGCLSDFDPALSWD